jgi:hypothetical protein
MDSCSDFFPDGRLSSARSQELPRYASLRSCPGPRFRKPQEEKVEQAAAADQEEQRRHKPFDFVNTSGGGLAFSH